ncbi:MAG: bifunctional 5,10-methylenetetrahydrofolate dehydrogenase/5,10-methenyltetrahydrofolate cyclohydrolase [Bacillota bacterium]|nr:bifunctional 5,10-methylenetetrahydrofolate dehydrogenase/5,10-methenyltetrahydrofolate cyclohydrolase [Bacillota bacterium]
MVIDCKKIAEDMIEEVRQKASGLARSPKIVSVVVGTDGGSESYLNMMEKTFAKVGFETEIKRLPEETTTEEAIAVIDQINADSGVDGCIIHKPLPKQIAEGELLLRLSPDKDLDGFHPMNLGLMFAGAKNAVVPCTAQAAVEVLKRSVGNLSGKNIAVIGRSNIVGKPLSILLLAENATVTVCHSKTRNLSEITKKADIVVVAVGSPRFLTADMVGEHSIVIDVGTNNVDGKMVGDADFANLEGYVNMITPVPGGVGRVTNAILLSNALTNYMKSTR